MNLAVSPDFDLTSWHTFAIPARAHAAVTVSSIDELKLVLEHPEYLDLPKLVLGGGSNVVFAEDFAGLVIRNRILGREVDQCEDEYRIHLGAGEDWDDVIRWTLVQGMPGLENMALIPGTVGAAPIQNIGAYGAELAHFCSYVDYLDLHTLKLIRLAASDCQFGYRDSIFKRELLGHVAIVAVGLVLPKKWQPRLNYGPLQQLKNPSAQQIYDEVVCVRQSKLPDPAELGNAGSFFKNPVISEVQYAELKQRFVGLPGFPDANGIKVPAGWLIEQCKLKGYQLGGAAVHQLQALVLVNKNNAVARDVMGLANHIIEVVKLRYQIELEPEVRILDKQGQLIWR